MRNTVKDWLMHLPRVPGVLACGVRFPDQTSLCQSYAREFPIVALEHAWRAVADTFQVLTVHRLPAVRLRWVYQQAALHCVRRQDELIVSLFVTNDPAGLDAAGVEQLIAEFRALGTTG